MEEIEKLELELQNVNAQLDDLNQKKLVLLKRKVFLKRSIRQKKYTKVICDETER